MILVLFEKTQGVALSPNDVSSGVLELILNAGPVGKTVLLILLGFSVVSWALIVEKWWLFRRVKRQTLAFLRLFGEGRRAATLIAVKRYKDSPLAALYGAACQEVYGPEGVLDDPEDGASPERLDAANRALRRAAAHEVSRLERYLPFLATTASATPFIGLFGTVWGIMTAFHGIGQQGSASLAVVAPGISEALIATAFGLGAAIPAVIGYNYFVNRVKHWATEMEGFTLDLLNLLSRPVHKVARAGKDGL
jgi:biopolymer transport protein TolQ